ncbi:hypothetical protein CYMTET_40826 [Cymbomonas tetramitiformis]|uniref:Uncharacterized protein n=1 Tax=Cymbomonas tetramitiformis TaxID=36881 RepID=A0AAE0F485_9CHLO|nr:hypothetical protein CYMTET_40826 [Cymbomonas tetramitiformis]
MALGARYLSVLERVQRPSKETLYFRTGTNRPRLQRGDVCASSKMSSSKPGFTSQHKLNLGMQKRNRQTRLRVASDEAYESTAIRLEPIENVEEERRFVAGVVKFWLNEEWAVLDCHEAIGEAAAEVYVQQRLDGEDDLGSIVLNLGGELLGTDFSESFIGPFEVGD